MEQFGDDGLILTQNLYNDLTSCLSGSAVFSRYVADNYDSSADYWKLMEERTDPITGVDTFHSGTDIKVDEGTPFYAQASGKVQEISYNDVLDNYLVLGSKTPVYSYKGDSIISAYRQLYALLSQVDVKLNWNVFAGRQLGLTENSGDYTTGPHLHSAVYADPKTNPLANYWYMNGLLSNGGKFTKYYVDQTLFY